MFLRRVFLEILSYFGLRQESIFILVCILEHLACRCGGLGSLGSSFSISLGSLGSSFSISLGSLGSSFSISNFFSFANYKTRELIHIELVISILVHVGKVLVPFKVRTKNTMFLPPGF